MHSALLYFTLLCSPASSSPPPPPLPRRLRAAECEERGARRKESSRQREIEEREREMERGEVEVWKKLLKIFRLMFHVAPTSDHSIFTAASRRTRARYTPQDDWLLQNNISIEAPRCRSRAC